MSATYSTCMGMHGERTARGSRDGCRASVQSYDGSVCVSNWYDGDQLKVRVGTSDGSSAYSDWNSDDFVGSFEDLKALLRLHREIEEGKVSVVRHRAKR